MNIVTFPLCDITPEQWADFTKETSIKPAVDSLNEPLVPYVLVHSRSQGDYTSPTRSLTTAVKTEFNHATYFELNDFMEKKLEKLPFEQSRCLHFDFYVVFDEQSLKDRKVIFVNKDFEWVDAEGNLLKDDILMEDPDGSERPVWRVERVPYKKAADYWTLLSVKPGLMEEAYGDKYLEKLIRPTLQ